MQDRSCADYTALILYTLYLILYTYELRRRISRRGSEQSLEALLEKLEKEKVIARGSPDLFSRSYRRFGVDEAQELRARARSKPVAGAHRVFLLFVPAITTEAQNALLKTLEEPVAGALFFLIVPSPEMLLTTIRSRVQHLSLGSEGAGQVQTLVNTDDFLAASPDKRLTMLKPLYEHDDPPAGGEGRDIGAVIAFLQSLETYFVKEKRSTSVTEGIRAIYRARKYATDKGSLLKALLEQVALLAPRM